MTALAPPRTPILPEPAVEAVALSFVVAGDTSSTELLAALER